ncbi:hypothetical protein MKEN_00134900 [Mycena kentingensis (nom. inval.)]|nr:hypothetical protein MKEN_00134900 [Mycena kentingensis (nom. inval.)]
MCALLQMLVARLRWLLNIVWRRPEAPQAIAAVVSARSTSILDLNHDVLLMIFAYLRHRQQLEVSTACRRFREVLVPRIYSRVIWVPGLRAFPHEYMWPHIRRLRMIGHEELTDERRVELASELAGAIHTMRFLRDFTIEDVQDGLWTELLDVFQAARSPVMLDLRSAWVPEDYDQPVRLNSKLTGIPISEVDYLLSFVFDELGNTMRRPDELLEIEGGNLRNLLGTCRERIQSVSLPGDLLVRAFDAESPWPALKSLFVEGFWPAEHRLGMGDEAESSGATSLLSLLEAMPNLRRLVLTLLSHETDPGNLLPIISADASSHPSIPESFLRGLEEFDGTALASGERLLDFLPAGLRSLTLRMYPLIDPRPRRAVHASITPSILLDSLERATFSSLQTLNIWYTIKSLEHLEDEEPLLSALPRLFPDLQHLELHRRWAHQATGLAGHWDPIPRLRVLLSQFEDLRTVKLNISHPERTRRQPFMYETEEYFAHLRRLYALAEEVTADAPSLESASMYREFGHDRTLYWETWSVGKDDEGTRLLEPRPRPPFDAQPEIENEGGENDAGDE